MNLLLLIVLYPLAWGSLYAFGVGIGKASDALGLWLMSKGLQIFEKARMQT